MIVLAPLIILSALGVIFAKKPVHSCLSFLLTLFGLAALFLELSAPFIAVMQILVYAGAILVIFMFVIVLFQDAYLAIEEYKASVRRGWLLFAGILFSATLFLLGKELLGKDLAAIDAKGNIEYGTVQAIAKTLYVDFFFPFEAVALLFLVAIVGSLYIGKKVK
ncbi:MAG: NADH-quinone oxidoreductase subunit J [Verrucomicrobia bacterium]|nr:NADH-quinone oxidoreductase subunit J [Verrucomicrobiota bacterium]MBS0637974.1 NADH-quinone oxidoreductase subunit J [Verrucomicrobiota bacterium]